MKNRIFILILAVLLLLTGCTPVTDQPQQPNDPVRQDTPVQNDAPVQPDDPTPQKPTQPVTLDYDLGTVPTNITDGGGRFAMAYGFVYASILNENVIVEYDTETGKAISISLPERNERFVQGKPYQHNYLINNNLFLLSDGIGFIEKSSIQDQYRDEQGNMQLAIRHCSTLSILSLDGTVSTPIPELGNNVYRVIPMKKLTADGKWEGSDADNPLAGLQLYCSIGYDTFPEKAAQMAEMGILLEEPKDSNERNKYVVLSLVCFDGDTREMTVLTQDFTGGYFVDEEYIYFIRYGPEGQNLLFRSRRDQIDFQQITFDFDICNFVSPYDGGVYLARAGSWSAFYYKDGAITDLPVVGCDFARCGDKLIYYASHWQDDADFFPIKSYDLNTGEIRTLCENAEHQYGVLGDRYVACRQDCDGYQVDLLIDVETGEQTELFREQDRVDNRPEEVKKAVEEARKKREEERKKQEEAKKQQESSQP